MMNVVKNAAEEAGFGAAEEEKFTRMCRVVGVAEGVVLWCRWCRPDVERSKKGSSGRQEPAKCGSLCSSFHFLSNELYLSSIRQEMAEIGRGSVAFRRCRPVRQSVCRRWAWGGWELVGRGQKDVVLGLWLAVWAQNLRLERHRGWQLIAKV